MQHKTVPKLSGKILLAEDNEISQRLLKAILNRLGASLTLVSDGLTAVESALHSPYDLILMDIQMPGLSGLEAVAEMRKRYYEKPVVALSANTTEENQRDYLAAGFDALLKKPIVRWELYAICERYLHTETGDTSAIMSSILETEPDLFDLVKNFVSKLPDMLAKSQRLAEKESWGELSALTHDLKGLGGSFGYPEITRLAGEIEQCVKQQPSEELFVMLDSLQDIVLRIVAGMQQYQTQHHFDCL